MQPTKNESKTENAVYQIDNRHSSASTCHMLAQLFNQGMAYGATVITDIASTMANSPSAPRFVRHSTQQNYDPIATRIDQQANTAIEYQPPQERRNSLGR